MAAKHQRAYKEQRVTNKEDGVADVSSNTGDIDGHRLVSRQRSTEPHLTTTMLANTQWHTIRNLKNHNSVTGRPWGVTLGWLILAAAELHVLYMYPPLYLSIYRIKHLGLYHAYSCIPFFTCNYSILLYVLLICVMHPGWVPGLRIDPLRLLPVCRKRRLNQAPLNLRGLIWLLVMDWSERGNIRKRGPLWEPYRKNSALCSWQANQSWFKERRNPQAPNRSARGNRKKHHITVRDLLRFLTSSWRFS